MTTTEQPVVNLAALAYRDAVFTVKHPISGKEIGKIAVASPANRNVIEFDDAEWRKTHQAIIDHQRKVEENRKYCLPSPAPLGADMTPEGLRERLHRRLAVHVLGADFKVKVGDDVVDFGSEVAFTVFNDPSFIWLTATFQDFVATNANFIGDGE